MGVEMVEGGDGAFEAGAGKGEVGGGRRREAGEREEEVVLKDAGAGRVVAVAEEGLWCGGRGERVQVRGMPGGKVGVEREDERVEVGGGEGRSGGESVRSADLKTEQRDVGGEVGHVFGRAGGGRGGWKVGRQVESQDVAGKRRRWEL